MVRRGLVLLTACGTHAASIDDAAILDTGGPDARALDYRETSAVVIGDTTVSWARGIQQCPFAADPNCELVSPLILTAPLATGVPKTMAASRDAVLTLVGDDSELFYVYFTPARAVVQRMRPNGFAEVISQPEPIINGLVIDATNVYWLSRGATVGADSIWRASRSGNGSDATSIAAATQPERLVTLAGYLWWNECDVTCTLRRVAVTGGTPETVTTDLAILGAGTDTLYLGSYPARDQIVAMTADGTTSVVVDHLAFGDAPADDVVVDRGELFWRTPVALLRVPATGGSPTPVTGLTLLSDAHDAFGLTADAILYNFTRDGYQTAPR